MEKQQRIAILLPDLRGGGAERVNIDLAHEFARAGHQVEFVLMQARGELLDEAQPISTVVDLATPRMRSLPFALTRYLRRRRPDALLAAMWPLTGIAGFAARLSGQPLRMVASEHVDFRMTPSFKGYERWILKRFGRHLYGRFHRVVAVSAGVADSLHEVAGLPPHQVTVIHNPVRPFLPEKLSVEDRAHATGWLAGELRLIAIGSLKQQKGFDVLLRALAELRKRVDAQLLILGDGGLRGDLENLAATLDIADNVWMPGFRHNPGAFLQHADVFVLSSHWEGFGNVIIEALSAGVTVVSTDCPSGPAEILDGGRYGRLTQPGDWHQMAFAIEESFRAVGKPDHLKRRAAEFRPSIQAARYLQLLTER